MISALFCVASAIYFEARGEPIEGQAAAAWEAWQAARATPALPQGVEECVKYELVGVGDL